MLPRLWLALVLAASCTAEGAGPIYKVLHVGNANNIPFMILEVQPGLFCGLAYGTPYSMFSLTSTGTYKKLYRFPGLDNVQNLVQNTNGTIYGAAYVLAGANYYFSIAPDGTGYQQYPFAGSWGAFGGTVVTPSGVMYDLAGQLVFPSHGNDEIYGFAHIQQDGQAVIVRQFSTTEFIPNPLYFQGSVYALDGNMYGLASQAPSGYSPAFIYRLTPSGRYAELVNFGSAPNPGGADTLIAGRDGNLYGSFSGYGHSQGPGTTGTIYRVTLSGQVQILAKFPPAGLVDPMTLMQASDGNLYGTDVPSALGYSQLFKYDIALNQLSAVYNLPTPCPCTIIEGMDGKLYGVNTFNVGMIFSVDIGLPKPAPVITALYPPAGPVGQSVTLFGSYLLGATAVSFNGTPATSLASTSIQSIKVTVPSGATTGPVTVTTVNGSVTTAQNFTVE